MPTAVLFDLDGVLVDTEPQYSSFWTTIGDCFFPEKKDFALQIKGRTLTDIFSSFLPDNLALQKEIKTRLSCLESGMTFPVVAGCWEFIDTLRREGYKTAVVTSSNQDKMNCLRRRIPDFDSRFDLIFTAEDAPRPKPAPDCYLLAASRLGYKASECYIFEDSPNGLQAARDSGAKVIGVATTLTTEELAGLSDLSIPDFNHLTTAVFDRLNHSNS